MTFFRSIARVATLLVLCAPWAGAGEPEHEIPAELRAEVPALSALHESIFELWHGAWPERDTARMKELLPTVEEQVAAVAQADLPGILRDKQGDWSAGVAGLEAALDGYRKAAAADSEGGLVAAVEALHGRYEGLVRIIRPVMPELQNYHVTLYGIYHYDLPEARYDAIAEHAVELDRRCGELAAAPVPSRFESLTEDLAGRIQALCAATSSLRSAASDPAGRASLGTAVETVHTRYQAVEALFD